MPNVLARSRPSRWAGRRGPSRCAVHSSGGADPGHVPATAASLAAVARKATVWPRDTGSASSCRTLSVSHIRRGRRRRTGPWSTSTTSPVDRRSRVHHHAGQRGRHRQQVRRSSSSGSSDRRTCRRGSPRNCMCRLICWGRTTRDSRHRPADRDSRGLCWAPGRANLRPRSSCVSASRIVRWSGTESRPFAKSGFKRSALSRFRRLG